jgi:hypothetical protein
MRIISGGSGAGSSAGGSSRQAANQEDPEFIRQMLAANPDQLSMLKQVIDKKKYLNMYDCPLLTSLFCQIWYRSETFYT